MRLAPRIAIVVSILTLIASIIGFVAVLILNAFVLDEYDAYGEVPIPGSASLELPAGETTVSFHTATTGRPTSGFPIPELSFSITPSAGLPDPTVTESIGGTTSVNSDVHVRIWTVQIAQQGTYDVKVDGAVDGYISPRLAFGRDSSNGWLVWVFGGLFALGLLELFAAITWSLRANKKARLLEPDELVTTEPSLSSAPPDPSASYTPSDQGVRLEQIRQLAALRDSGALTEEEYNAEKRRILDS
ncbi:SHOCT domain-containing protein [Mycobacterium barrassiae]|uniref:SHOCT domain-containing protein n=1 Tax=Mycobacterium barrassiae TaxID=319709 RepID=UPI0022659C9A|nr:SHOCT domain-containing protein [Mycobacterium barrassiae]MCV7302577.1 SHOCT domain-containing protein [Mycobacterium barrassiae]